MFACTLSAFHHWVSESLLVHFTVLNRPAFIIRTTNNTYLVFIPSQILTIQEFNLNFLHQCLDFFHFNYFLFFICLHIIWHFRDILLFLKYIHLLFQAKKRLVSLEANVRWSLLLGKLWWPHISRLSVWENLGKQLFVGWVMTKHQKWKRV